MLPLSKGPCVQDKSKAIGQGPMGQANLPNKKGYTTVHASAL
jgi:hypothetical protein